MTKRKIKVINRQFQFKTTFSILGIVIISFLIVTAFLGIEGSIQNNEINTMINDINNALYMEDKIVNNFIHYTENMGSPGSSDGNAAGLKNSILKDHKETIEILKTYTERLHQRQQRNFKIITGMLGIILFVSAVLYFYLINMTHRISGPLHVVKQYMDSIISGEDPEFRELREKDEFKELYYTFVRMMEILREEDIRE